VTTAVLCDAFLSASNQHTAAPGSLQASCQASRTSAAAACMRAARPSTTGLPRATDSAALVVLPAGRATHPMRKRTGQDSSAIEAYSTRGPAAGECCLQYLLWRCRPSAQPLGIQARKQHLMSCCEPSTTSVGLLSTTSITKHCSLYELLVITASPMSKGGECSHLPYHAATMSSGTALLEAGLSCSAWAMHSAISLSSVTCRKAQHTHQATCPRRDTCPMCTWRAMHVATDS
jgi:hypothetical protein